MQLQPESVKDELRVFLGSRPRLQEIEDYLPPQRGRALDGASLKLKKHQAEALEALQSMRDRRETIALLCHATGTGKTVTAVLDAKRCGGGYIPESAGIFQAPIHTGTDCHAGTG